MAKRKKIEFSQSSLSRRFGFGSRGNAWTVAAMNGTFVVPSCFNVAEGQDKTVG